MDENDAINCPLMASDAVNCQLTVDAIIRGTQREGKEKPRESRESEKSRTGRGGK